MKSKKTLVSLTLLLILLHSCTSAVKENEDGPTNAQWFQGLVCQFPCWENITPQKTLYEDVRRILLQEGIESSVSSDREISFQTKDNIDGSIFKSTTGTVDKIILFVSGQGFRLDGIVQILVLQREFALLREFDSYYEILRFTLIGEQ